MVSPINCYFSIKEPKSGQHLFAAATGRSGQIGKDLQPQSSPDIRKSPKTGKAHGRKCKAAEIPERALSFLASK